VNRLTLALLVGVGLATLSALLINIRLSAIEYLALLLLTPGGILASLLIRSEALGSPLLLLAANSFLYSVIAFLALRFWIRLDASKAKRLTVAFTIPVLILDSLACIRSVSPIWPRGMSQLADEENALRVGLPPGSTLETARAFLHARAVNCFENEVHAEESILQNAHATIVAKSGDRVLSALIDTEAQQFPCGYKIQIALVFGADERLRERYIERTPICP